MKDTELNNIYDAIKLLEERIFKDHYDFCKLLFIVIALQIVSAIPLWILVFK